MLDYAIDGQQLWLFSYTQQIASYASLRIIEQGFENYKSKDKRRTWLS